MDNSLFYINFQPSDKKQKHFIEEIEQYSERGINPIYVVNKPVSERKTDYDGENSFVVLAPKHKLMFINSGKSDEDFEEFVDCFVEDIGYIAKKHEFVDIIGRPRKWRDDYTFRIDKEDFDNKSFEQCMNECELKGKDCIRTGEILISLVAGSINEATRLGQGVPNNLLDQIKRKIVLFDGEQTRFIFDEPSKKRIIIQGLAGTGKTELLLHKIKELYTKSEEYKIVFTCHNEILADNLRKRVPKFFDFMKVEEQIKWKERLWVMRSWGSYGDPNSGVYSYICHYYNIPFNRFSYRTTFDKICQTALEQLENIEDFEECFDYVLIDESQDFSEGYFALCEKVAKKGIYVAGDIFQDIFENRELSIVNPDFLLNKCYRTDPRTLMGAHAIGMGLFEKKLRWLKDEEWESCGYEIKKEKNTYLLFRKPLKRFEDLEGTGIHGIEIVELPKAEPADYTNKVLEIMQRILDENPTVEPDDIGIMFLENMKENYAVASDLQMLIKERLDWDVNIGYETKEKRAGTVFISNRNNVKGLEFPFVICIMRNQMNNNFQMRNSIYMMLTRSFLTSYFVIPKIRNYEEGIVKGIDFVNKNGYLCIEAPSKEEKVQLYNAIINRTNLHKSQYDIVEEIMDELQVKNGQRTKLHDVVKTMCRDEVDREKLYEIIQLNLQFLQG